MIFGVAGKAAQLSLAERRESLDTQPITRLLVLLLPRLLTFLTVFKLVLSSVTRAYRFRLHL